MRDSIDDEQDFVTILLVSIQLQFNVTFVEK